MDATVDHYTVLGLPSGEEGANLTYKDINKAYKSKALELHQDKRRGDPNAASNFQQLRTSYDILKDEKARKLFDDLLRVKRDKERRQSQRDGKRRKMVSDLEWRERDAFSPDLAAKGREEEDRIAKQLKDEIARIHVMHAKKFVPGFDSKKEYTNSGGGGGIDEEKVLKVLWEKDGKDYSADKLRELFSKFGEVEDVIRRNKKKCYAFVVMATKQGAVATIGNVIGNLANPLLVLPLKPAMTADSWGFPKFVEPEVPSKLFGSGYQAFEDSVLMKLQKAAAKQRCRRPKSGTLRRN